MINWPTVATVLVCSLAIILVIRSLAVMYMLYCEGKRPSRRHETLLRHINAESVNRAEREGRLFLTDRERHDIDQLREKLRREYGEHGRSEHGTGTGTTGFTPGGVSYTQND